MSDVSLAIVHALERQGQSIPPQPCLVMGDFAPVFADFPKAPCFLTPYKGQHDLWRAAGCSPHHEGDTYKSVLLLGARQSVEADGAIAQAMSLLMDDGLLMMAAFNDSGGRSLKKRMENLGLKVLELAKHKCRVVWGIKSENFVADISPCVRPHRRADGLWTQAGVFSWDKVDKGSAALLQHLDGDFCGNCADFGAGIGVLGREMLAHNSRITRLDCFDHDARAAQCCVRNMGEFGSRAQVNWTDITTHDFSPLYDGVVMNPPFHDGRLHSSSLGITFIGKACDALKKGGWLLMVANTQLPYEDILVARFAAVTLVGSVPGFKILHAVK